jgi:hypothetical protein
MNEWRRWCEVNGRSPAPAAPADIAAFVEDIAELGIERVWPIIQSISAAHAQFGLADPTRTSRVSLAINAVSKIEPPRSWPKEEHELFLQLPYDVQKVVLRREAERDRQVRKVQNERDALAQLQKIRDEKSDATNTESRKD